MGLKKKRHGEKIREKWNFLGFFVVVVVQMLKIRTYPTFLGHTEEQDRFSYTSTSIKHEMFCIFE